MVADSILGLAKSHEFEYRAPTRELDHWEVKRVTMKSAAGDPDLHKLFFSQLRDEAGQSTMLREVDDGGFIEIRSVFAMTLACAFVAFSSVASAAEDGHESHASHEDQDGEEYGRICGEEEEEQEGRSEEEPIVQIPREEEREGAVCGEGGEE